jgi:hypothetical protein
MQMGVYYLIGLFFLEKMMSTIYNILEKAPTQCFYLFAGWNASSILAQNIAKIKDSILNNPYFRNSDSKISKFLTKPLVGNFLKELTAYALFAKAIGFLKSTNCPTTITTPLALANMGKTLFMLAGMSYLTLTTPPQQNLH